MSQSKNNTWVLIGKDGRTHALPCSMIFIGREECEIILQAASADKRHAVVYYSVDEQEFLIKDLNSLTGTYVNGIRIPEQTYVKLKHLDCIRFGYGPDVFYLGNNADFKPSDSVHAGDATIKLKSCEPNEEVKELKTKEAPLQSSPLVNRTDLPPDTLPLNLSEENVRHWRDENLSDSPDYSHRSESSSCSAPANSGTTAGHDHDASSTHSSPAAMAFTVAFENEVSTPRKKLGIRDSIRKFAPSKPETENRHPKAIRTDSQLIPASETKSSSKSLSSSDAADDTSSNVKDAASFLIEKMLNTDASLSVSESTAVKSGVHKEGQLHDANNDDRSEAGTYTVEAENNDGDVEEARKRIDEVFGVIQIPSTLPQGSASLNSTKQIPSLNGYSKVTSSKSCYASKARGFCDTDPSSLWPRSNRALSRGRRLIPAPVENVVSGDRPSVDPQRLRRNNEAPATPDKSRRPKLATSPKSPSNAKTLSAFKTPASRTNNLSATTTEKNTSNREEPGHHRSPDNRSDGSKSPHSSTQWRKVPWNLSGSDAELDQSKSENNSVLSDTSTEPSSQSSHSGKNKPEHGPQMRLNRAFALRRARLEADSAKQRGSNKDGKVLTGSQKAMKKSSKLSASTTTLREENASLRGNFQLAPAIAKPFGGKSTTRSIESRTDAYRRKPEIKSGHRRIESDPGKGIPVWRVDSRPSTAGGIGISSKSATKPTFLTDGSGLQSFHRSMSCSVMNDAEIPLPVLPCSYVRSFEHNMISGSQIVPGPTADDYQTKKHPNKELTALDSLVISAIHQLSSKLWSNSKALLEKEREKCQKGSDCWLMIEEVLPSMPLSETPEDGDLTKDLSSILKNLKRVEQGLEVLSCVLDSDSAQDKNMVEKKTLLPQNFFIVDM